MHAIRGTKEESKELRWLAKAQSTKGDRHVLEAFHKRDGLVCTTDGFRLHVIPTPTCFEELPKTNEEQANYTGKIPSGDFVTDLEAKDFRYPDVSQIMPTGEPTTEFAINPKLLRDALGGMEYMAVIRQYKNGYITVQGIGDQQRYAVIAPMHQNGKAWAPNFTKEEVTTE